MVGLRGLDVGAGLVLFLLNSAWWWHRWEASAVELLVWLTRERWASGRAHNLVGRVDVVVLACLDEFVEFGEFGIGLSCV